MSLQGIDVSYANGQVNWPNMVRNGVQFAFVKASQGKLLNNPKVGPFVDPQFTANVKGARSAGLEIGVYHYLCANNLTEANKEAKFFSDVTAPYRDQINLWYVIDAEEDKYLPSTKAGLTNVVLYFARYLESQGRKVMLYTNPNYLVYKLGDVSSLPIWLAYWGVSEQSALRYKPTIWQYGSRYINGLKYDGNIGYFDLPNNNVFRKGDKVEVLNPVIYNTNRHFALYYDVYTILSIQGARAVIGVNGIATAAIDTKYLRKVK